jgi:putative SOS response-associated peptidase YedK
MCGRASLIATPEELEEAFGLASMPRLVPRYNIAPSEPISAVREVASGARELTQLRWGLIRPGSEDAKAPINLRVEAAAKGAMKSTLRDRRCLIPMTGFYEWRRDGKLRQPFNVRRRDGKVFGVAGVWERLESGDLEPLESCLVLTMAANAVVEPIHGRMPVILDPTSYGLWLGHSSEDASELMKSLRMLPEETLESYPVSTLVNRAGVEDPRCVEPSSPASLW